MALIDNLISYWKLDEESGNRVDSHASNDLTDNSVTFGTGKINNGADFESLQSKKLSITDASQSGLDVGGDFSISAWVKLESVDNMTIASKWETDGNQLSYYVGFGTSTINSGYSANGSSQGNDSQSWTPSTGFWYHLVYAYDASVGMTYYVNGTQQGSQTSRTITPFNCTAEFALGARDGDITFLDGILDEVGIWNKELTSDEVTLLYNGGNGLAYPLSEGGESTPIPQLTLMGVG